MIILATAIILSLNSSGIIGKANQAKTKSDTANLLEAANVVAAEWELEYRLGNISDDAPTYIKTKLKSQGFKDEQIASLSITETGAVTIKAYTMYKDSNNDEARDVGSYGQLCLRGGDFYSYSSDYPASYRDSYDLDGSGDNMGFRVTLYIK